MAQFAADGSVRATIVGQETGAVEGVDAGTTAAKTRGGTQVAANAAAVPLLAASAARKDGSFMTNDSSQTLYVRFAASDPTVTNYDVGCDGRVPGMAGGIINVPDGYKGEIRGIWAAADATGNANIVQFT